MKSSASKKSSTSEVFKCTYCDKTYKQEKSFAKHVCEQKKRYLARDSKPAILAYAAFRKFHEVNYRKDLPPYEKFMKSSLYLAFLRFGEYIIAIDAIDPQSFMDFVVRNSKPIDKWCTDAVYDEYIRNLVMKETPERAVERTFIEIHKWVDETGKPMRDFFREISAAKATSLITVGRLSPWVFLNCDSGAEMLRSLNDEQIMITSRALNMRMWRGKISRHPEETKMIRTVLKEQGM